MNQTKKKLPGSARRRGFVFFRVISLATGRRRTGTAQSKEEAREEAEKFAHELGQKCNFFVNDDSKPRTTVG